MSKSIKIIALLMAMMFVFFAFASCTTGDEEGNVTTTVGGNDTPDDPTGTTQGNGTVTDKPENTTTGNKYDIGTEIPSDVKFDGETVNIASRSGSDWTKDEISVEFMSGGVQDTIFNRQVKVEDTLGITINNIQVAGGQYEISNHIRDDFKANEYRYDVVANSCYSTIMYTSEGIFTNLFDLEYLDLSRPYWSQGLNEAAEIGDAQYMCSGAVALTFFRYMFVTFFNQTLVKNYGDVNFYELVDNYEWTLDYQITYCERFADTSNESLGAEGTYGFASVGGNVPYIDGYWSSCKLPILSKKTDGWFEVAIDTGRMVTAVDKIIKLYDKNNLGTYIHSSSGGDDGTQSIVAAHFASDHAATATMRLCSVEGDELKNMESVYGIIPMPMLNKEQKAYGTVLHDQFTAIGVYSRIPDADKRLPLVGAFLETFAAESYKQVVPAYYDLALKNRYLQDEESGRMLDLIYESVYVDAGILYTKNLPVGSTGGVSQEIRMIITNGPNTVGQKYGPQTVAVLKAQLKRMQDAIAKIQG